MKNKYFYLKVFGIVTLIMSGILYFLLYFVPTLKSINRYRRQLKDTNLKIADYMKVENTFTFASQQEEGFISRAEQELTGKIPEIRSREEFIALFTSIADDLQQQAKQDGIFNLLLKSQSQELQVDASSLSSDKKTLGNLLTYTAQRLSRLRKEQEVAMNRRYVSGPTAATTAVQQPSTIPRNLEELVPGVKYHTITLSFTGELKPALNFINHIPWSSHYIKEDKILVSAGEMFPYYIVFLRVYYLDRRGNPGTPDNRGGRAP